MKENIRQLLRKAGDILEIPMRGIDRFIAWLPISSDKQNVWMERKYGVIGTVLFHIVVIVLFLIFNVGKTSKIDDEWIYFDLKTPEELAQLENKEPDESPENQDQNKPARNIAVNQQEDRIERYDDYQNYRMSNQSVNDIVQSRINDAVKEIIDENDLNPNDKEVPNLETKPLDFYQATKIEEDKVYEGPTNIYYKLDERKVAYLHVPVYKCAGGATVRIDIRVGQRGKVEIATVNNAGTDTRDPCFLNAAKNAAQRTRFNFSTQAPLIQTGYIIYHFISQ